MTRFFDPIVGICLFLYGAFWAWFSLHLGFGPFAWLFPASRVAFCLVLGLLTASSAVGLFFSRRRAGLLGAACLVADGCFLLWSSFSSRVPPPVISDVVVPACCLALAVAVYWRFVQPSLQSTATA